MPLHNWAPPGKSCFRAGCPVLLGFVRFRSVSLGFARFANGGGGAGSSAVPVVAQVSTQFPTHLGSLQLSSTQLNSAQLSSTQLNSLKPALTQLNSHKMIFLISQ